MNSDSNTKQTFAYIEHMLIELRQMSEKQNAPVLAYLIEMAIIESKETSTTGVASSTYIHDQLSDTKQLVNS